MNETQAQFAERFSLTRDDVSNYELERCKPPLGLLVGIDRLNFNIRWLLTAEGDILRAGDVESRNRLAPGTFDMVE